MSWFDRFDPSTPQGMQLAGLLGGFNALGAGLLQAGAPRPVGQPGPTLGDAFGAFGQGQRAGLQTAMQNAQMQRQQQRQTMLANARSDKPDDQLTPRERATRAALSKMSPDLLALADDEQLPALAVQRATSGVRQLSAQELAAGGYKPGSVVYVNDFTGAPNVVQQSDVKSPEAEAQAIRMANASRAAPQPVEVNGRLVDPRTGRVIYDGGGGQPLSPANAWNEILRYAPLAAAGKLDPNSAEGQRYLAAQTILTQPRPVQITQPDGSVVQVMQAPEFPFPRLQMPGQGVMPPAAGGAAPPSAPGAPASPPTPQGTVVKPPPPLTESQGNATMYLQRMQEAEKRMSATVASGYNPGGVRDRVAAATPLIGNFAMSEKGQNYRQAQEDWVRAKLRKESGAVIAKEEMEAEIKTYFPQPGDAASTIQQKALARQTAMDALRSSAGPGVDRMVNTPPAAGAGGGGADPLGILGPRR